MSGDPVFFFKEEGMRILRVPVFNGSEDPMKGDTSMANLTQKNIDIAITPAAAPFGAAVLLINIFNEEEDRFVTASCEGYKSWQDAVGDARRALRKAAIKWQGLDLKTVEFLSDDPEDCTSVQFQEKFEVETSGSFDPDRKLLILRIEEDWSGQPVAEVRVLSTPELPVNW